jgi:hypothetical protein
LTGNYPEDNEVVLNLDLNKSNVLPSNLRVVPKAIYRKIQEAYKNVTSSISIKEHPEDKFCVTINWYSNGQHRKRVVGDIVVAERIKKALLHKYLKILTSYCIFD